jgi:hypothetical protein
VRNTNILLYFVVGISLFCSLIPFVRSDHLWKPRFFKLCLVGAVSAFVLGVFLESTDILQQEVGFAIAVMTIPLIYLLNFQLCRWVFKRRFNTEPYITSSSSTVGAPPQDLFTSANIDGKHRKYEKDRKIMTADFVFSFAQGLIPAFTALLLIYFTTRSWR